MNLAKPVNRDRLQTILGKDKMNAPKVFVRFLKQVRKIHDTNHRG